MGLAQEARGVDAAVGEVVGPAQQRQADRSELRLHGAAFGAVAEGVEFARQLAQQPDEAAHADGTGAERVLQRFVMRIRQRNRRRAVLRPCGVVQRRHRGGGLDDVEPQRSTVSPASAKLLASPRSGSTRWLMKSASSGPKAVPKVSSSGAGSAASSLLAVGTTPSSTVRPASLQTSGGATKSGVVDSSSSASSPCSACSLSARSTDGAIDSARRLRQVRQPERRLRIDAPADAEAVDADPALHPAGALHPAFVERRGGRRAAHPPHDDAGRIDARRVEPRRSRRIAPGLDQREVELALDRLEQLQHLVAVARRCGLRAQPAAAGVAAQRLEGGLDEMRVCRLQDQRRGGHARRGGRGQVARRADGDGMLGHDGFASPVLPCCRRVTTRCPRRACSSTRSPRWRSASGTARRR